MEKEKLFGLTEIHMKEIGLMEKKKEEVYLFGKMEINMKVILKVIVLKDKV